MEALIYVSTATILPRRSGVAAIVNTARRVNPTLGLTGMLLWRDMHFAQLLEGPTDSLDELLQRLHADTRHRDIIVLTRWEIERRLFPDWSMGCREVDPRQPWDLLERLDLETPGETAAWLLYVMNQVHRRIRRSRTGVGVSS